MEEVKKNREKDLIDISEIAKKEVRLVIKDAFHIVCNLEFNCYKLPFNKHKLYDLPLKFVAAVGFALCILCEVSGKW